MRGRPGFPGNSRSFWEGEGQSSSKVRENLNSRSVARDGLSEFRTRLAHRSHRPKPAFRKVILDGDRRSDGRYLEISATPCPEGATLDWGWPPTYGSGPFALATPCTHVPGRYSGPSKFKSRVAHPWSWDIGSSTSAAWTSLNMVLSCRKARPFGLSTKLGLQESGRPSPKGTALWPEPCSMD